MPVVKDEQDVKPKSQFLEYEVGDMGNNLILLSHLYQIDTHYLKSVNKYIACRGESKCMYCGAHYPIATEYRYFVDLNGKRGYLNIKATPFFDIQKISKSQHKDPRQISWTVIKTGAGKETQYTTSKNDNLDKEDYEKIMENVDEVTNRLAELMEEHEENLDANYTSFLKEIREQKVPKAGGETQTRAVKEEKSDLSEDNEEDPEVDPDKVPF